MTKAYNGSTRLTGGRTAGAAALFAGFFVAFLAAALVAPAPSFADRNTGEVEVDEPSLQQSVFGAYIAAGHAEIENDFARAADLLDRVLATQPEDPLLQRRAMLANLHAGRVARAIELARPQIVVYPSEVDIAALTLATDAIAREDWARATKILTPPRRIALARYSTPMVAAWAQHGAGETDAAIETLSALRDSEQADVLHDLHAGLIFLAAGRPAEAEAVLAPQTADLERTLTDIPRALARARQALGDAAGASDLLRGFDALHPGVTQVERDIAALEAGETLTPLIETPQQGAAASLIELARQVRDQAPQIALRYARLGSYLDPMNGIGFMVTGMILQELERPTDAIDALEQIDDASPFHWNARMEIADSLMQLDRDEAVIAQLEAMAEERTDDIAALNKLGLLMRIRERFADGTAYYDRALDRIDEVRDEHWYLFYYRGITLERTKRWPEAEADFRRALELRPDDPYVLNYLGYSWVDQGTNIDEAMAMIRSAVSQLPNDGNIVDSLGWAHYRLGEYDEAVLQLERAIQLHPSEPVINDHLGDAYWKVGRRLEARYQWRHALSLDPDDDLRAAVEEKLKKGLDAVEAASAE